MPKSLVFTIALIVSIIATDAVPSLKQRFMRAALDVREVNQAAISCSPLKNRGSHSTVLVKVGTPAQSFNLVADTGSDHVIVQSCLCKNGGFCPATFGSCFQGTNKSSTFLIEKDKMGPPMVTLSFGSGDIAAVVASDEVTVGKESAFMGASLLLMVKQALAFKTPFEGILGLGRPHELPSKVEMQTAQELAKAKHLPIAPTENEDIDEPAVDEPVKKPKLKVKTFLGEAKISRFSMCFNYQSDGVLSLNTAQRTGAMGSVGKLHWGLDFQGISVGGLDMPVKFCSPKDKSKSQESSCGIIPDSGTTVMMGPKKHIAMLFDEICAKWPRCGKLHEALVRKMNEESKKERELRVAESGLSGVLVQKDDDTSDQPFDDIVDRLRKAIAASRARRGKRSSGITSSGSTEEEQDDSSDTPKRYQTFQLLLQNCGNFKAIEKQGSSLDQEMPTLYFKVAGKEGTMKTLELKPYDYIIETPTEMVKKIHTKLEGILPIVELNKTKELVCTPAFSVMEMNTAINGPVWIFGTPLFYKYQVHYDTASDPPSMFFEEKSCGSCVDGSPSEKVASLVERPALRRITTDWRYPEIDVTQPL